MVENFDQQRLEGLLLVFGKRVLDHSVALVYQRPVFKAELFALCRESDELRARVAVDMRAGYIAACSEIGEQCGYGRSAQVEFAFYVALAHGRARLRILVHKDERLQLRPRNAERGKVFAVAPCKLSVDVAHQAE